MAAFLPRHRALFIRAVSDQLKLCGAFHKVRWKSGGCLLFMIRVLIHSYGSPQFRVRSSRWRRSLNGDQGDEWSWRTMV